MENTENARPRIVARATFHGYGHSEKTCSAKDYTEVIVEVDVTYFYDLYNVQIGDETRLRYSPKFMQNIAVDAYERVNEKSDTVEPGKCPWMIEISNGSDVVWYFADDESQRVDVATYSRSNPTSGYNIPGFDDVEAALDSLSIR